MEDRDGAAESSQWLDSESTCCAGSAFPAHCMCNIEKATRAAQTWGGLVLLVSFFSVVWHCICVDVSLINLGTFFYDPIEDLCMPLTQDCSPSSMLVVHTFGLFTES